jgi:DNA-directed RNA polymerase
MADLSTVFDGLNVLGQVPWKINKDILEVAKRCWDENISLGDIPSQTNYEVPDEPVRPLVPSLNDMDKESPEYKEVIAEVQKFNDSRNKFNRIIQRNMASS